MAKLLAERDDLGARKLQDDIDKHVSNGGFTMDTAYVWPKFEFGSVIWDPHQYVYIDDIESIQKKMEFIF